MLFLIVKTKKMTPMMLKLFVKQPQDQKLVLSVLKVKSNKPYCVCTECDKAQSKIELHALTAYVAYYLNLASLCLKVVILHKMPLQVF
ncbi:hypothetical protein D3C81_1845760 [compost metagenome]